MTAIPPFRVKAEPGTRLAELLAAYDSLKPQADELESRLKSVTDAIKAEVTSANPDVAAFSIDAPGCTALSLIYGESWRFDAKTLKTDDPLTYVKYAKKSGTWTLKRVSS